jgi:hypothetical protein
MSDMDGWFKSNLFLFLEMLFSALGPSDEQDGGDQGSQEHARQARAPQACAQACKLSFSLTLFLFQLLQNFLQFNLQYQKHTVSVELL